MERFLLDNIPVAPEPDDIIKRLRLEEDEDVEIIKKRFAEAKAIARPKALYTVVYAGEIDGDNVTVDGVTFTGPTLARALKDAQKPRRLFAYVCTCGREADEWSRGESDYVVSLWLDTLKERFLYDAVGFLRKHIMEKYNIETMSSVNPGSGNAENWPIEQLRLLFPLIGGVEKDTGVTLTDSCLMLPTKSVCGIYFPSDREFVNCSECERAHCPNRRAEYAPMGL